MAEAKQAWAKAGKILGLAERMLPGTVRSRHDGLDE
jgi:hypothetical protein